MSVQTSAQSLYAPVVQVIAHWPDGRREELEFGHWPSRKELPKAAVYFEIAWPDESLEVFELTTGGASMPAKA